LILLAVVTVALTPLLFQGGIGIAQNSTAFDSPIPTPSPSPSLTPWPTISPNLPNAERALQFVAQRQGIPQEWLILAEEAFAVELPPGG